MRKRDPTRPVADVGSSNQGLRSDRLQRWVDRKLIKFNKDNYRVLHLGRNNALHQYRIEANWLKSTSAEKVVRILVDS